MSLPTPRSLQLAWPFALIGAAVGAQLPAPFASAAIMALVLGLFGALVSGALPRVGDWQVAVMSPFVGAATGATVGWSIDSFDGAAVGVVAGIGFGLFALPPLVLITDGARRAMRLPARSFLARAAKRRVWLLALSTSSLAALVVPGVANPWSHPAEAPLSQSCASALMMLALVDACSWIAQLRPRRATLTNRQSAHPYREGAPTPAANDRGAVGVLAAESLLYDAMLVAVVASALLVSR
ncbi:MAG TPA: hypothetical protein VGL86_16440 [Polyangia bacterium]|jgi:hypothetical protein